MKTWFVAHTQAQKELIAQRHLLDQGFEIYLPRFKKTRRHARKTSEVLAPLFPRYIFIAVDLEQSCWRSINGTRGICYLLMNDDKPAMLSDAIIQALKEQENAEGLVPASSLDVFNKGDRVRVLEGAFKDHIAVFETLVDQQRVELLLKFLGRETIVSLPSYAVEAA